ncbi:MAG: cytochrome c peroxidase [Gammaproteobacteria bacterium]|nr:cytochrome c peroxidase [Gammaproteobacteria bacterium]
MARACGGSLTLIFGLAVGAAEPVTDGPGDYKGNYDSPDYVTRSVSLEARVGRKADLLAIARHPPLGLPPQPVPEDNPLTREKVELGRKLFFDRRLSLNGTQSCAMCHIPEQGFTNNELATAVGLEGRDVGRNAPTLYNVGYKTRMFHDARESSLEQQAWQPIVNPLEMASPSIGWTLERIRNLKDYDGLFEAAFDGSGPDMNTVADALASYQRTLLAADSPFDRWYYGDEENALDASAQRGFELFTGRGNCSSCHLIGEDHALFTDDVVHNTGTGYRRAMEAAPGPRRVALAPGVFVDVAPEIVAGVSGPGAGNDLGRYEVTGDPADRWHYKTPTLRNVALTAPYMHDGSLLTLADVVDFYDRGGVPNPLLDPRIRPLGLSERERADLLAFLEALTGDYRPLVLDAFVAPVGDVGSRYEDTTSP